MGKHFFLFDMGSEKHFNAEIFFVGTMGKNSKSKPPLISEVPTFWGYSLLLEI